MVCAKPKLSFNQGMRYRVTQSRVDTGLPGRAKTRVFSLDPKKNGFPGRWETL